MDIVIMMLVILGGLVLLTKLFKYAEKKNI